MYKKEILKPDQFLTEASKPLHSNSYMEDQQAELLWFQQWWEPRDPDF